MRRRLIGILAAMGLALGALTASPVQPASAGYVEYVMNGPCPAGAIEIMHVWGVDPYGRYYVLRLCYRVW